MDGLYIQSSIKLLKHELDWIFNYIFNKSK